MKRTLASLVVTGLLAVGIACKAPATPSTTYWSPASIDVQPPGVWHFGMDNYSTVGKKSGQAFPVDYGLTWGASLGKKIAMEWGVDYFSPSDDPWFLNAKVGFPEGALGANAPAVQFGAFNFGFKKGVTNQNIVHMIVGKSLPKNMGRLTGSYYYGNPGVLKSSAGKTENTGFMVAYDKVLVPGKLIFAADYITGKNAIGGGGAGVYFFLNKDTSVLVGPVWFNDKGINGDMKWTAQLDANFAWDYFFKK